jgi:hypothetical protein
LSCPSSSSSIHHFLFTSPAWCAPPCCCCSFCAATDPVCCPVWWRQQKEPADCFMTYIYLCGSITSSSSIRPFSLSLSPAPIDPSLTPHSLFYRDEIDIHTHLDPTGYAGAQRNMTEQKGRRGRNRSPISKFNRLKSFLIYYRIFQTSFATTVDAI